MTKTSSKILIVKGAEITVIKHNEDDYISLTNMAKIFGEDKVIENWLRNKNTVEFLRVWEGLYNPNFNSLRFEGIKQLARTKKISLVAVGT